MSVHETADRQRLLADAFVRRWGCASSLGHVFPAGSGAGTLCACGLYERNESDRGMRRRAP